ncbi:type II toxin-antitoxin system RelE/ParE family toxin [Endothiovibrio diazotrophicus]
MRLTGPARRDIARILQWSGTRFGESSLLRYRHLIDHALQDLAADAARVGVRPIDDIRAGYFVYHLKWSRNRAGYPPVRHPRHLIAFFIDRSGVVIVARLFHERQMLEEHLMDEPPG